MEGCRARRVTQVRGPKDWGPWWRLKPISPLPCCRILYTTYYESIAKWGPFFGYYFFNVLLVMLQLLHVFWSCLILRMIYSFMKKGRVGPG